MSTRSLGRVGTTQDQAAHPTGLRRSARLLALYRREPQEPEPFYEFLARDTVEQLKRVEAPLGGLAVDIGGGPGYFAQLVRRHGGRCVVIDYASTELRLHGRNPEGAVVGDGQHLPLRSGVADVVHCSNVLEHVVSPGLLIDEMVRSLRIGGIGYLAFTPWLSPWGGHETSPWHYLGGDFALRRYERRHQTPPKNRYGASLFALRLAPVRRQLNDHSGIEVLWQGPRYWPASWHGLSWVPLVGEIVSWNHLTLFRRTS